MRELTTDFAGQVGVEPRIIKLKTTDSFATITAEGYLNSWISQGYSFNKNDIVAAAYGTDAATSQLFTLSFDSDGNITMEAQAGDVVTPVTANHIAVFTSTTGAIGDDATTAINGGNIQAGLSGTAGALVSFPATETRGSLKIVAVSNSGDTATTISNAAMGQASVISIPDPGASTANFIISKSAGTQSITSGNLAVSAGNITAGASGAAGTVTSYPGTAANGSLIVAAVNNSGNHTTTISNASTVSADTVLTLTDPGQATGSILVSKVAADPGANLISFDVTVGQAALASGGSVTLVTSSGSKRYKIRSLQLNSGGTNFSGGGGDRLGQVTDGTTVYSVIPAATMQSLANAQWGVTALPNPAAAAINTSSVAGTNITFKYSGGATDYTAGSLVISGIVERVV